MSPIIPIYTVVHLNWINNIKCLMKLLDSIWLRMTLFVIEFKSIKSGVQVTSVVGLIMQFVDNEQFDFCNITSAPARKFSDIKSTPKLPLETSLSENECYYRGPGRFSVAQVPTEFYLCYSGSMFAWLVRSGWHVYITTQRSDITSWRYNYMY